MATVDTEPEGGGRWRYGPGQVARQVANLPGNDYGATRRVAP
ncbi:hypothetical protein [Rhodococcus sp. NPDC058639]